MYNWTHLVTLDSSLRRLLLFSDGLFAHRHLGYRMLHTFAAVAESRLPFHVRMHLLLSESLHILFAHMFFSCESFKARG